MENSEKYAQEAYRQTHLEDLQKIARDEEIHESRLIELIDEEGLNYMSSVVLGLNDALVEFTGALAGYTFALQHAKLVALTGAITGIAAALSMAASEYLSTRTENNVHKNALKSRRIHRNRLCYHCRCPDFAFRPPVQCILGSGRLSVRSISDYSYFQLLLFHCQNRKLPASLY